jgi:XTP/dITP diphosphohydrolase
VAQDPVPITWLITEPTQPGLLNADAWVALHAAPVRCADPHHPQREALTGAGVVVDVLAVGADPAAAAATLRAQADRLSGLTWLAADGEDGLRERLAVGGGPPLRVLRGAPVGTRLLAAVAVMDRLRSPGGCPWDAEQTHTTLTRYLLEESYEVVQALDDDDLGDGLRDELGDVLLQVLFHARIAAERPDGFDIDGVAGALVDKLVRRHPHVFAGAEAPDAAAVVTRWDAIKSAEKAGRSLADGVPAAQPPLAAAQALLHRAARAGRPVPPAAGADVGARILAVLQDAERTGVDAEAALRAQVAELRRFLSDRDGV